MLSRSISYPDNRHRAVQCRTAGQVGRLPDHNRSTPTGKFCEEERKWRMGAVAASLYIWEGPSRQQLLPGAHALLTKAAAALRQCGRLDPVVHLMRRWPTRHLSHLWLSCRRRNVKSREPLYLINGVAPTARRHHHARFENFRWARNKGLNAQIGDSTDCTRSRICLPFPLTFHFIQGSPVRSRRLGSEKRAERRRHGRMPRILEWRGRGSTRKLGCCRSRKGPAGQLVVVHM